jgi:hypothetical protein
MSVRYVEVKTVKAVKSACYVSGGVKGERKEERRWLRCGVWSGDEALVGRSEYL